MGLPGGLGRAHGGPAVPTPHFPGQGRNSGVFLIKKHHCKVLRPGTLKGKDARGRSGFYSYMICAIFSPKRRCFGSSLRAATEAGGRSPGGPVWEVPCFLTLKTRP